MVNRFIDKNNPSYSSVMPISKCNYYTKEEEKQQNLNIEQSTVILQI